MAKEDLTRSGSNKASLDLLYHISRELASDLDLRTVLLRVLKLSLENVPGGSGTIIVLDHEGQALDSIIVVKNKVIEETTEQLKYTLDKGLAGWVLKNRKAALVPDTSKDKRWQKAPKGRKGKAESRSSVSAPLLVRRQLVGVMTLTHPEANLFDEGHLDLLQTIADQAAFAVLNARLYAESQRRAQVMTAIADSAAAITASLNIDEVLQRILEQITAALDVEAVSLALINAENGEMLFRAATGDKAKAVIGLSIEIGQGVIGWVAETGESVIVRDAAEDTRFYARVDQITGYKTKTIACSPIRSKGKLIGVLEAINPKGRNFNKGDLSVLDGIGNLAGAAIEHAQLFEQVEVARSRYLELFEDSIDPILITDWDDNIREVNRQAELLLGIDEKTLLELSFQNLHDANFDMLGEDLSQLRSGETVFYESKLHSQSLGDIAVEIYVHRILVDEDELLQWIVRDVTERRNLDNLREDLASMIYHDLRSPLANVVSGLDVLEMILPTEEDPTVRSVLDIAMRSTERVQRLATSLLDTSRMEAGQSIGNPEPSPVDLLVREAIEAVATAAEGKDIEIKVDLAKELPPVLVDADMIKRVLINLLENAIKYSKDGMPISIGAKHSGKQVEFWVEDKGRGIAKAEQERIFEKFTQSNRESKIKSKGLGLGLAYCKLAVEGHGGKIWVKSTSGKGSRFSFSLPIA
jgi:PAS domain S-box-containing protein